VVLGVALACAVASRHLTMRTFRSAMGALHAHDPVTARRELDKLRPMPFEHLKFVVDRLQCTTLLIEERWNEALVALQALDRDRLQTDDERAGLDEDIAWARLNLGEGEAAVALAESALARVKGLAYRVCCLGTLGAALVVSGRPSEAVPVLERALAAGDDAPARQATRAHWLGEALRALGRFAEARVAYERAVASASTTAWGRRARAQLDALPPGPYR
jgi:uncharacterized protein HemY